MKIIKLSDLFKDQLSIPNYQRPYTWKEKNVTQLLNDIFNAFNLSKNEYRVGTVILHNSTDIVDGQQRLVSLTLVLHFLKQEDNLPLLGSDFKHDLSKANIKNNYAVIENWFNNNITNDLDRKSFANFITEKCEFVKISLDNLSDAFQLFDAQNARGKPLEAFDLLKAYHLREMEHNSDKEKLACVTRWEASIERNSANEDSILLGEIIGTHLFRIRKWAKGVKAGKFSKNEIDEFKGINLHKNKDFPYLKPFLINEAVVNDLQNNPINSALNIAVPYPFQITQMIINGKNFFDYVAHYTELHNQLFRENKSDFHIFYKEFCLYDRYREIGNTYVLAVYEALILQYVDKFGEYDFVTFYKLFYRYSFNLRLKYKAFRYNYIDSNIGEPDNAFNIIEKSYFPNQIFVTNNKTQLPDPDKIKFTNQKAKDVIKKQF